MQIDGVMALDLVQVGSGWKQRMALFCECVRLLVGGQLGGLDHNDRRRHRSKRKIEGDYTSNTAELESAGHIAVVFDRGH